MSLMRSFLSPVPLQNYAPEGLARGSFVSGVSAQERSASFYPSDLTLGHEPGLTRSALELKEP